MLLNKQETLFWQVWIQSFTQYPVKDNVSSILEIEPCPNCGKDMVAWKCSDSKICWYGHGQNYLDKKTEQRLQRSLYMQWNWQKYELITLLGEKFYYFDYYWRIKENRATIELYIKWEILKFEVEYEIKESTLGKTIENIRFFWDIKKQSYDKTWKRRFKKHFIEYKILKKYVFSVLSDIRFNKFLLST